MTAALLQHHERGGHHPLRRSAVDRVEIWLRGYHLTAPLVRVGSPTVFGRLARYEGGHFHMPGDGLLPGLNVV